MQRRTDKDAFSAPCYYTKNIKADETSVQLKFESSNYGHIFLTPDCKRIHALRVPPWD